MKKKKIIISNFNLKIILVNNYEWDKKSHFFNLTNWKNYN